MLFRYFITFVLALAGIASSHSQVRAQIRWTRTIMGQNKIVIFRPGSLGKVLYAAPHDSIGSISVSWDGGYNWASISGDDAPLEPTDEAEGAKVPLPSNVWQREGADAPDAADIEDPATQL